MNKSKVLSLLTLFSIGTCLAEENIDGKWNCEMVSDYGESVFSLTLNKEMTFKKKQDMFGKIHVGIGKWHVDGKTLIMNRETYIKDGVEKASSQEFKREITSSSDTKLVLQHGSTVTSCTK